MANKAVHSAQGITNDHTKVADKLNELILSYKVVVGDLLSHNVVLLGTQYLVSIVFSAAKYLLFTQTMVKLAVVLTHRLTNIVLAAETRARFIIRTVKSFRYRIRRIIKPQILLLIKLKTLKSKKLKALIKTLTRLKAVIGPVRHKLIKLQISFKAYLNTVQIETGY